MIKLNATVLLDHWRSLSSKAKLGAFLVIVANILIGSLVAVPFLDLDLKTKAIISTVIFVIGEICFYAGLFLLGKEIVAKYRKYFSLSYWRNRKKNADADKEKERA